MRYEKPVWVAALVAFIWPGYFLIGLRQDPDHAHVLATALDHAIPYSSAWMFVYGGVYTALLLPCFVVKDDRLFRRVALAYAFTLLASYLVFALYPVTTKGFRPDVASLDTSTFWGWGAALNYSLDPPMNSFPSLHVATMTLATLIAWRVDRPVGYAATPIAVLIALSTLVVKQHYLADVVAGAALAALAYRLFIASWDPGGLAPEQIRQSRWGVVAYLALYLIAIFGVLFPMYAKGVRPWENGAAPVSSGTSTGR